MTPDVELEERIAATVRRPLSNAVDNLLRQATAEYVRRFGSLDATPDPDQAAAYVRWLNTRLTALPTGPTTSRLLGPLGEAQRLGAAGAARDLGIPARDMPPPGRLPPSVVREARAMRGRVVDRHTAARRLLTSNGVESYTDVVQVLAVARQSVTSVDRTVRWAANRAIAEGATAVIAEENVPRVWVPERDACLHCLAYAGEVAKAGEDFPTGLTFGDHPLSDEAVPNPPLHPGCRCRVQGWRGDERDGETTMPDALRREAQRTVLRGRSEHASNPARLRAAERLLAAGVSAPASVKKKAAAAVARGRFE